MATIFDNLVGSCAKKLQDLVTEEAIMTLGVKDDLNDLQRTMKQIQCFVSDAEQRKTEELAVDNWLYELKDATYKADDIIDLARLEGSKLVADDASSSKCSATCIISQMLCCLPSIQKDHEVAIRIKNLNSELEKISKLGENYLKLQNLQPREQVSTMRMKTCELVEPNIVGKETSVACTSVVELILAHKEKKTYKIGIVGTGGVGKTTLAQKVYNDDRIKGAFSNKAWICVSQEYSKDMLLKEILQNIRVKYMLDETVGELSRKLAAAVENKTLFLVLDDIWQHEVWTDLLRTPLETAATTIILVTTRNDIAARVIGVEDLYRVELMSDDVGWELLWKSMNVTEEAEVQSLRDTGMEIVRLCGGLPLAIKVIARVLVTKERTENQWKIFVNKTAWSMNKVPIELRGALYLSYDDLPRHLKQCFLYCALYPKDEGMYRSDLIRFWIAEGFVEEEEELLEDTAEDYYNELIYRHLLQPDPILPFGITRLCALRRLGLNDTPIDKVPKGIGELKYLNDVDGFPLSDGIDNCSPMQDGWGLDELCGLQKMRKLAVAISLKDIEFIAMGSLKVVENFLFLSERLVIVECEGLERVSNIPHVDLFFAHYCPNLSCVEKLDKLQHLVYTDDMQKKASVWLPGIQQKDKDLVVYVCNG
ncbi:hypothetical protein PR202_gb16298 [Eleusine coracana subsp. coracana]|uniref:Uncharacterized protein n=1 Tax=Eleusine coracana subsp. coracana TaxID=191504 RepID=A0AAV5F1T1_ELECO|nr:hypothetical protein PR202_gb16298 [Eleusine coracana subsp. coracana]